MSYIKRFIDDVIDLIESGYSDEEIARELETDKDEVERIRIDIYEEGKNGDSCE